MTPYEIVKEWRKKNPEKVAAQSRRYRAKHPDKRKAIEIKHRAKHLEAIRERDRQAKRRLSIENPDSQRKRYAKWRAKKETKLTLIAGRSRSSRCEICNDDGKIVFDHCHAHGKFRGWICDRCNKMLGLVRDSPELLRKLAQYLEAHYGKADGENSKRVA